MKSSLFKYNDYKSYINDRIQAELPKRGFKMRIAEHVQCHSSHLSHVLNGDSDFTLGQASRLNKFFNHGPLEARYFVLLVDHARAGTEDLKEIFKTQIDEIQKSHFVLKRQLEDTEEVPVVDQHVYYSAWFYSAIHVALSIPGIHDPSKIAQMFGLPRSIVVEVIQFLEKAGLIESHRGAYRLTKKRLYLGKDAVFIRQHHINWRSQALQAVEKNLPGDFHFSSVIAISEEDFQKIREILIRALDNTAKVIGPSKEEQVYALTLDLFRLGDDDLLNK